MDNGFHGKERMGCKGVPDRGKWDKWITEDKIIICTNFRSFS